jgi:heme oxygenase (biliverdin-producing, ferredoxin)
MGLLLRGALDRPRYVGLLRSLLEIYRALEAGLDRHRFHPAVHPVRWPALYRTAALRQDLAELVGAAWETVVPPAAAALRYSEHLRTLASGDRPWLLAAHAYTRYLGDLHGGRVLGRIVAELLAGAPGKGEPGLAFYRFPEAVEGDAAGWRDRIRRGLDALPLGDPGVDSVVEEARDAFRRHIELFEELAYPDSGPADSGPAGSGPADSWPADSSGDTA